MQVPTPSPPSKCQEELLPQDSEKLEALEPELQLENDPLHPVVTEVVNEAT